MRENKTGYYRSGHPQWSRCYHAYLSFVDEGNEFSREIRCTNSLRNEVKAGLLIAHKIQVCT